jgi:hypothetical protein
MDYGMPDYDANIEKYQELGVTRSAYNMFKSLNFGDQDVFSLEVMEKILDMRKNKTVTIQMLKEFRLFLIAGMMKEKAFYPLLLFGVLWIFWSKKDAKSWLALLYLGIVFIGGYFYMYYRERFLENRVDVGLCFAASLVLIWMYTREKSKISIQGSLIACICLLIVLQKNWYSTERITLKYFNDEYDTSVPDAQQMTNIINEIEEDTEHIYFAKVGAFPFMSIQYMSDGLLDRVIWLGNYTVNTKLYLDTMASHGITNSYQYMLENDDVYLIDNNIDLTMEYIHDYYDKDATYQMVKQVGSYCIYKIHSGI